MKRLAVVLFNLGGPDRPEAVQPFLFNLFNDPAIISAPGPVRWLLAKFISSKRAPIARAIYEKIGGKSPLLDQTRAQAQALEGALAQNGIEVRVLIGMRYWHPFVEEAAQAVKRMAADRVILLPLYPQFSTTTTGSSLTAWEKTAAAIGLEIPTATVCCYPTDPGFITALADGARPALAEAAKAGKPRLLFSAHGLPKKIVNAGDPYPKHVEATAQAVAAALNMSDLDWRVCYQSRVGPLEWIGPSTDDEIAQAGQDKVPLVVTPLAFVSEHSETLVELDIEYAERARHLGVPAYIRTPAVGTHPAFIAGLARLAQNAKNGASCGDAKRACAADCPRCPLVERR